MKPMTRDEILAVMNNAAKRQAYYNLVIDEILDAIMFTWKGEMQFSYCILRWEDREIFDYPIRYFEVIETPLYQMPEDK